MENNYLYVLDHSDCTLNCLYLNNAKKKEDDFNNIRDLLRYWGFNPDECAWMFSDIELDINHIVVPLKD